MGAYGQQIINTQPMLSADEIEEEEKPRQIVKKKEIDNEPMKPLFVMPNL